MGKGEGGGENDSRYRHRSVFLSEDEDFDVNGYIEYKLSKTMEDVGLGIIMSNFTAVICFSIASIDASTEALRHTTIFGAFTFAYSLFFIFTISKSHYLHFFLSHNDKICKLVIGTQ